MSSNGMNIQGQEEQVTGAFSPTELIRANVAVQLQRVNSDGSSVEESEELRQLRRLYDEEPGNSSTYPEDFESANVAREQLQKIVDKFDEDAKPSTLQKLGFSHTPMKTKVADVLRNSIQGDIDDLKVSIDNLEIEWKEKNGPVYATFKKLSSTLDEHKTILTVFPSQNNYASLLVGSVTILMKAAKTHSDIADILSKSIAEISDKVATCSNIIAIIKTARARRKLAEIYARMFQFYQGAIEWYLQSKLSRFLRSFNENLVILFKEAKSDIEDSINELYREAALANTAIVAIINGKISNLEAEVRRQRRQYERRDALAGQRMQTMMQTTWTEVKQLERMVESAAQNRSITETAPTVQDVVSTIEAKGQDLEPFIIGDEGPRLFDNGRFWLAEDDVLSKLRAWMTDGTASRTLWISSPYESGGAVTGSRAAALATVAAAWQAETPVISYFCKRPRVNQLWSGMCIEQIGLIGLVYSFIRQLLQFNRSGIKIAVNEQDLTALNGKRESWDVSLTILRTLLDQTPGMLFCVIDSLNDLEWGSGAEWCKQFLDLLRQRQRREGAVFNVLITTVGQSRVLPLYVELRDRQLTTKRAREVERSGSRIRLLPVK